MSRLKEAIKGAFNWAGYGLLSFALLSILSPLLGPTIPILAANVVVGIANTAFATMANPVALSAAAGLGFFGATAGFFHKDAKK